uniref:Uncharacterized protein n=1 Tax=Anopheles atroparvus TaxID=41427 RepID=A0A182IMP3_ANOAO
MGRDVERDKGEEIWSVSVVQEKLGDEHSLSVPMTRLKCGQPQQLTPRFAVTPAGVHTTAAYSSIGLTQQRYSAIRQRGSRTSGARRAIRPSVLLALATTSSICTQKDKEESSLTPSLPQAVTPAGVHTTAAYSRIGLTQQRYSAIRQRGSRTSGARRAIRPSVRLALATTSSICTQKDKEESSLTPRSTTADTRDKTTLPRL